MFYYQVGKAKNRSSQTHAALRAQVDPSCSDGIFMMFI
jgi:hypothetical protein